MAISAFGGRCLGCLEGRLHREADLPCRHQVAADRQTMCMLPLARIQLVFLPPRACVVITCRPGQSCCSTPVKLRVTMLGNSFAAVGVVAGTDLPSLHLSIPAADTEHWGDGALSWGMQGHFGLAGIRDQSSMTQSSLLAGKWSYEKVRLSRPKRAWCC